jgi:hypothetical protein
MALTTYVHAANSNTTWNLPVTWGLSSGFPNSNEALISLSGITTSFSAAIGDNITAGKIIVGTNTANINTQVGHTSGKKLILDPVNYGGIAIEITDGPPANYDRFLLYPNVQFVSDSELRVASPWQLRFGPNTGVISGNVNIRKTGGGLLVIDNASPSLGSLGKTFTIAEGSVRTEDAAALGSADMAVIVQSGAVLWPSTAAAIQKSITISGSGNLSDSTAQFKCYGAFLSEISPLATTVFTIQGANATYTQTYSGSCVSKFTGTVSGEFEINSTYNGGVAELTNAANDYVASGGVRVSSKYYVTGAKYTGYVIADNDKTFGATSNNVIVDQTGRIRFNANTTTARNYTFDGAGTLGQVDQVFTTTFAPRFTGNITVNGKTEFTSSSTANTQVYSLEGSLSGNGEIVVSSWMDFKGDTSAFAGTLSLSGSSKGIILRSDLPCTLNCTGGNAVLELGGNNQTVRVLGDASLVTDDIYVRGTGKLVFEGASTKIGDKASLTTSAGVEVEFKSYCSEYSAVGMQLDIGGFTGCKYTFSTANANFGRTADATMNIYGGVITLNHAGCWGSSSTAAEVDTSTVATKNSAVTLDTTVAGGLELNWTGALGVKKDMTWRGTESLTLKGNLTLSNKVISFEPSKTGTLRIKGNLTTSGSMSVGGSPSGGSRARLRIDGTNAATLASFVTAGYLQVNNANGLGAAGSSIPWSVSDLAAIEIGGGVTIPTNKTLSVIGLGPNSDGCLRGVNSGTNVINGPISIPATAPVLPTRFKADSGNLTLTNTGSIATTATSLPLSLDASSTFTLTVNRAIPSGVGALSVNASTGSTGTVVLSVASGHTGALTVESGLCKVTVATAIGTGAANAVNIKSSGTLKTAFAGGKATYAGGLTFGTTGETTPAVLHIGGT